MPLYLLVESTALGHRAEPCRESRIINFHLNPEFQWEIIRVQWGLGVAEASNAADVEMDE